MTQVKLNAGQVLDVDEDKAKELVLNGKATFVNVGTKRGYTTPEDRRDHARNIETR